MQALDRAAWQYGGDLDGVIHHADHGSNYTAMVYTDRIAELGAVPSTGTVGDSYDNALAEAINNLYKTELIRQQDPWKTVQNATRILSSPLHLDQKGPACLRLGGIARYRLDTVDACLASLESHALPDLASLETLATTCGKVHQSYSDYVMLCALLAALGSEVAGLQVGDIDWENRIVTIRRQTFPGAGGLVTKQTKGRNVRHVPILQALAPVLERLADAREPEDRLVTGPRGGVLTTATVRDATKWDTIVTELGLPDLTRHGLRDYGQAEVIKNPSRLNTEGLTKLASDQAFSVGVFSSYAKQLEQGSRLLREVQVAPKSAELQQSPRSLARITPEHLIEMVADYEAGMSAYELADKYGHNRGTIMKHLASAGVRSRVAIPTKEEILHWRELRAEGLGFKTIARLVGRNHKTIRKYLVG